MLKKSRSFLQRLLAPLLTSRRYKQLSDSVSAPGKGFGRSEWVLSRPLYRFARFELKSVPKPQRAQALELQIRQWVPFSRTGWYLLWDQDNAQVWAWDAERVEAEVAANKLKPKNTAIVPETVLHQRRSSGVHLIACMEGYEGQAWTNQVLTASRWWPRMPTTAEWINFQRDAATLPENQSKEVPPALAANWADKAWGKSVALDRAASYGGQAESWAVPALLMGLIGASMWYGLQLNSLQTLIDEQAQKLNEMNRKAEPILASRSQALEALSRLNVLQSIDPYPDQLSILAKVAESLPKDGTYLKEWEFQNGKLKVLISSPLKLASSDAIKLFQSMKIFNNVQVLPSNEPASLVLSMEVPPQIEIKFNTETNESLKKDVLPAMLPR